MIELFYTKNQSCITYGVGLSVILKQDTVLQPSFLVTSKVEQGYNENGNGRDARTQGNTCYNVMYLARANRRVIQVK